MDFIWFTFVQTLHGLSGFLTTDIPNHRYYSYLQFTFIFFPKHFETLFFKVFWSCCVLFQRKETSVVLKIKGSKGTEIPQFSPILDCCSPWEFTKTSEWIEWFEGNQTGPSPSHIFLPEIEWTGNILQSSHPIYKCLLPLYGRVAYIPLQPTAPACKNP